MKLSKKIFLTVAVILSFSSLIISLSLWIFMSSHFNDLELAEAQESLGRYYELLNIEIDNVETTCKDYARRESTYNIALSKSNSSIYNNFNPSYLKRDDIQFVVITDINGKVGINLFYDPVTDLPSPADDIKDEKSDLSKWLFSAENSTVNQKGIINTSHGLLFAASMPINGIDQKRKSCGKIIVGRLVNRGDPDTKSGITLYPFSGSDPYYKDIVEKLTVNKQKIVFKAEKSNVIIYSIINNLFNKPAALVSYNYKKNTAGLLVQNIKITSIVIAAFGFIIIIMQYFLKQNIIHPIEVLTARAVKIENEKDFTSRLPIQTDDEISTLAWEFNTLLDDLSETNYTLEKNIEDKNRMIERSIKERISDLMSMNQVLTLMEEVFKHSLEGIIITDHKAEIIKVNPAFTNITGYTEAEVAGKNPRILKSDHHNIYYYKEMWNDLLNIGHWGGEIWNRHKDGNAYPEWLSISAIRNSENVTTHYVGVFHDISDIKRQEELIRHQLLHDALTGLPNRFLLKNRIEKSIINSLREKKQFGVLFLDLDDFKSINDTMGHAAGDILLKEAAGRLHDIARSIDTVARHGSDTFVILIENMENENPAVVLAIRIIESFKEPFLILDYTLHVGISIGIAIFPEDGEDADILLRNADTALYSAKKEGKENFKMFMPDLNIYVTYKLKLENDLRKALIEKNFEVYYQPKLDIQSGKIMGMEGLARWKDNDIIISPDEFIPLAEDTGLITEIDRVVMDLAFSEISGMLHSGSILKLALNCSTRALYMKDFPDLISTMLTKYNIKPEWFELEITETSIMKNYDQSIEILLHLQKQGILITMDDFGTGYSSLAQLKNLPINCIKIDRSFVSNLNYSVHDAHIIESIITLTRKFGMSVVAEGVETGEQLSFLRNLGCDIAQGYYISKPLCLTEFKDFLARTGELTF